MRERRSEIEYQRATGTTITDKESDRQNKSDRDRERERGGAYLPSLACQTLLGESLQRDC